MKEPFKNIHKRFGKILRYILLLAGLLLIACKGPGVETEADLESGFLNPPESAKPRVWWHWMNGNITKEGIKADLEWMNRVGIGGFQNFDVNLPEMTTPQIVKQRLAYMTPEWKDAFRYAAKLADSLQLEMAIAGSPGWSESGGPWVTPAQAMKKLVWSEIRVEGGKTFAGNLPKPPTTTGRFQNIGHVSEYYADAAVIAFRTPDHEIPIADLKPKVTSSSGNLVLLSSRIMTLQK